MNKVLDLLRWCKYHTEGYEHVTIKNFTTSWKNGMGFNALLHRFNPYLVDYHKLNPDNEYYNNFIAFKVAESHFGIPSLLDPSDMVLTCPENLDIITYISQFYNCLKEMKPIGGPSVNKFQNNNDCQDEEPTLISSIRGLKEMKCCICRTKVYLLERYVAGTKLYHRGCYRDWQMKHMDTDPEEVGNYLDLYKPLKPNMNSKIFVHPFQGIIEAKENYPLVRDPPADVADNVSDGVVTDSDISEEFEDALEFLSSSCSSNFELCPLAEEDLTQDETSITLKDEIPSFKGDIVIEEVTIRSDDEQIYEDLLAIVKEESLTIDLPVLNYDSFTFHDDAVHNNPSETSPQCLKSKLYVKKRNKQSPYSTSFHMPQHPNSSPPLKTLNHKNRKMCHEQKHASSINIEGFQALPKDSETISNVTNADKQPPGFIRNSIIKVPKELQAGQDSPDCDTKSYWHKEYKEKLSKLNAKQIDIETKGRILQRQLWDEEPSTELYDNLLNMWLDLVDEKDKLFYEESTLYAWLQEMKNQESLENPQRPHSADINSSFFEERCQVKYKSPNINSNNCDVNLRPKSLENIDSTKDDRRRYAITGDI